MGEDWGTASSCFTNPRQPKSAASAVRLFRSLLSSRCCLFVVSLSRCRVPPHAMPRRIDRNILDSAFTRHRKEEKGGVFSSRRVSAHSLILYSSPFSYLLLLFLLFSPLLFSSLLVSSLFVSSFPFSSRLFSSNYAE